MTRATGTPMGWPGTTQDGRTFGKTDPMETSTPGEQLDIPRKADSGANDTVVTRETGDSIWEQLEEGDASVQIRRITVHNPLDTLGSDEPEQKQRGRPKERKRRGRSAPAWLTACRRDKPLVDLLKHKLEAAPRRPYVVPPARSTPPHSGAEGPDEVGPYHSNAAERKMVKHYKPPGAGPPYVVIIEDGTMNAMELNYVREATRQMAVATARHRGQLHMVFVEDDELRELREKTYGHIRDYKQQQRK